jgi:hypothetical protein
MWLQGQTRVSDESEYEVELILDKRQERGIVQYLVRWKDCDSDMDEWVPASPNLHNAPDLVASFERDMMRKREQRAADSAWRRQARRRQAERRKHASARRVSSLGGAGSTDSGSVADWEDSCVEEDHRGARACTSNKIPRGGTHGISNKRRQADKPQKRKRGGHHECSVCNEVDPRDCLLKCTVCEERTHLQCVAPPPPDDLNYQNNRWE